MIDAEKWFKEKLEEFKDDVEFQTEELILEVTEKVSEIMKVSNINRAELARRLGVSKAFVTKLLNGYPNLTLKTIVSISKAIGCIVNIDMCPEGFQINKFYMIKKKHVDPQQFTRDFTSESKTIDDTYECAA